MAFHVNLQPADGIHTPFFKVFADQTARTAYSSTNTNEVNKVVLQNDNKTIWVITAVNPVTYAQIGGSGTTDHSALSNLAYASAGHTGFEAAIGTKNTAFNVNFGTGAGTAAEGNDSRLTIYDIAGSIAGKPEASAKVFIFNVVRAFTLPASLTGSYFKCYTNPTATATLDIQKNGSSVGSLAVGTGGSTTVTFSSQQSFAAGDALTIVAPGTQDTTFADYGWTLKGTLS